MVTTIIAGQKVIRRNADARGAGPTVCAFIFFVSVGTLVSTVLGGYLFDMWSKGGPFLMMGIGSTCILLFAIDVRLRHGALLKA